MKYVIKSEIGLKIGGEGTIFPEICDFHMGAILTDNSMALFASTPQPRLEMGTPQQALPSTTQPNSWLRNL